MKAFAKKKKNEKQLETLIQTIRIYSQNIKNGICHWKMCFADDEK